MHLYQISTSIFHSSLAITFPLPGMWTGLWGYVVKCPTCIDIAWDLAFSSVVWMCGSRGAGDLELRRNQCTMSFDREQLTATSSTRRAKLQSSSSSFRGDNFIAREASRRLLETVAETVTVGRNTRNDVNRHGTRIRALHKYIKTNALPLRQQEE